MFLSRGNRCKIYSQGVQAEWRSQKGEEIDGVPRTLERVWPADTLIVAA